MKRSQCYPGLTPSNSDGVVWRERRRGGTEVRRRSGGTCAMENVWEVRRGRNVTGGSRDLVRDMTGTSSSNERLPLAWLTSAASLVE